MSLQPGTILGPYSVTAKIGEGGMGDDVSLRSVNRRQKAEGRRQESEGSRCGKDLTLPDQQHYMPLNVGDRLGTYEVVSEIGAGGMGIVYRARDTTLDRDVALKVLPEAFTSDPDRLARFEWEAKVLASLNHPNIGSIYGLEEAEGARALVLELVEGPTLADRIKQGPIPLDEALPIAKQIAEALEAAHEQGVIHRDLKPANVKVKADGTLRRR